MWRKRSVLFGVAILAFGLSLVYLFPGHTAAATGINPELSFEGKIVDGSGLNIPDGTYNVEFKIYTAAGSCNPTTGVGCTLGWTEDYLVSASQAVTFTSGTFQVNLGSVNPFGGSVDWNTNPLYLSIQIGSTSSCTPAGNFTANCGGDGEMKPYILLTATPYALNADKLDDLDSTAFGQLANSQTFTGANIFHPSTNVTGATVQQTSAGSPTADIFDVQGTNGTTNFLQITSTAANQGAVTLQSVGGSNALTLQSGSGTVSLGTSTNLNSTNGLTVTGGSTLTLNSTTSSALTIDSGTTGSILIGTGTGSAKTIQIGPNATDTNTTTYQIASNSAGIQSVAIGSTGTGATANAGTTVSIQGGTGANAISIGTTAAVNQVTVGSTNGASNTTIQGGTANINLLTNASTAGVVSKTSTNSTTAFEIQGSGGTSAVLFQADTSGNNLTLNGNNGPQLGTFSTVTATNMTTTRAEQATVISNGYIYSFGSTGGAAASTSVEFAKLNASGLAGTWATTTSLPASTAAPSGIAATEAVAANGYVYVLGGDNGSSPNDTGIVYYAAVNNDGTLGAWQTSPNDFSAHPVEDACAVTVNGYVYVLGGYSASQGTINTTVSYAKLNPDGSTSAWSTTTGLTNKAEGTGCTVANGHIYVVGGFGTGQLTSIQIATPSPTTGLIASWNTNSGVSFTAAGEGSQAVVLNGYLYRIGGTNGTTPNSTIEFGTIGSTGLVTGITSDTNGLGASRYFGQAVTANGYVYYVGGYSAQGSGQQNTTLYATSPRTSIAGSLDLVGISDSGALGDSGASGGSLTVGNANVVGNLSVNSGATVTQSLGVGGNLTVADAALVGGVGSTNSTNEFQVENSNGGSILNADSTGANQNNLISNPSIESNTKIGSAGDWQKRSGSETTFAQTLTQQYSGAASLKVTTSATAGDGAKQNVSLTNGTTYTLSFEAELDPASNAFATMQVGYAYNGSDITTLVSPSYTVSSDGWTRYSYTFTQNQTNSGTPYIFIKQTDATIHTFYIDAVTLQTDANADGNYREGKISIGGAISSPVTLENSANSTNALQVQDSSGASVFTVGTLDTNLLPNPGAEVNTAGWSVKGGGTIIRDTSQQAYGTAAFKLTGSSSGDGAQYTGLSLPVGTYSIGISIRNSGTAFGSGALQVGITNTGGDNACTLAPAIGASTPVTTGWTRYTCSVTIATTAGTALYIKQTEAVAHTYWADGIELDPGSTSLPYGLGSVSLNAVLQTPLTLQNQSNSTTAATIQNASSNAIFTVDTINNQSILGAANTVNGQLTFANSSNANTVSLVSGVTTGSYSLTLPTAAPTTSLCLQSGATTASQLTFGSCGGAGSGVTSVGTFDGGTPNATGATITSGVIFLQSASGTNPGAVNTTGQTFAGAKTFTGQLQIGSATTDTTQVLLQLDSFSTFADTATCTTSTNQGALYYNTASNAIRSCINGNWEDLVSTAGLGIISFGVVADSGSNPGDLPSLVTTGATGPCKVSWASATTVTVAPCIAYSGGRKVVVGSTTLTLTTTTTNLFENVCLTGTNGAPAMVGPATTQTSATIEPTFSANNPVLCLATIKNSSTVNGSFAGTANGEIYDTRTFTQTVKEFETSAAAVGMGYMAQASGTGVTISTATAGTLGQRGVVVATNGAATSGNNPNIIIATNGPGYVVATAGTTVQDVETSGTAGFAQTTATATLGLYAYLGVSRTTWSGGGTVCVSAATCLGSLYVDITPR